MLAMSLQVARVVQRIAFALSEAFQDFHPGGQDFHPGGDQVGKNFANSDRIDCGWEDLQCPPGSGAVAF